MRSLRCWLPLVLLPIALLATGFRDVPFLDGNQVMEKVRTTHGADSEIDVVKMVTVNGSQDPVVRLLVSAVQKDAKGNFRYLLRVLSPDDERGTAFLVLEKDGGNVDQYLYLPALGLPKKIEGSGRSGSFMGSDFTYEDLRKEKPGEWTYDRDEDEKVEGTDCYVIMATPADKDREKITGYTYRFLYIDKSTFDIRRVEFLDSKQQITKELDVYNYQPATDSVSRPRSAVMTNKVKDAHTIMTLISSRINQPLPDDFFSLDTIQHWGPDQDKLIADLLPKTVDETPVPLK
jgi:hypothetical protein